MKDSGIHHVADTAFLIAECRAIESAREDALFNDPFAARLSGEKGKVIAAEFPRVEMTKWMTAVRTVIIDNYIRDAIADGVTTIINLGAGLDTRPYRLDLPNDLGWIEVDYPSVITYKENLLADATPRCNLERISADLADNETRRGLLDDIAARPGRKLFITEGVVPYLDLEQAGALAKELRAIEHVYGWVVDYVSPESQKYRNRAGVTKHMRHTPFKFQPENWFDFFAVRGWRPREVRYLAIEGARMGRRVPLPLRTRILIKLVRRVMPTERRERLGKFAGYVLLEPAMLST